MKNHRSMFGGTKIAVVSALAFVGALVAGTAVTWKETQAQSSCEWYSATSLKQQQKNVKNKCGFKGPLWHSDLGKHMEWCASVSPDEWKKAAKERGKQLAACK